MPTQPFSNVSGDLQAPSASSNTPCSQSDTSFTSQSTPSRSYPSQAELLATAGMLRPLSTRSPLPPPVSISTSCRRASSDSSYSLVDGGDHSDSNSGALSASEASDGEDNPLGGSGMLIFRRATRDVVMGSSPNMPRGALQGRRREAAMSSADAVSDPPARTVLSPALSEESSLAGGDGSLNLVDGILAGRLAAVTAVPVVPNRRACVEGTGGPLTVPSAPASAAATEDIKDGLPHTTAPDLPAIASPDTDTTTATADTAAGMWVWDHAEPCEPALTDSYIPDIEDGCGDGYSLRSSAAGSGLLASTCICRAFDDGVVIGEQVADEATTMSAAAAEAAGAQLQPLAAAVSSVLEDSSAAPMPTGTSELVPCGVLALSAEAVPAASAVGLTATVPAPAIIGATPGSSPAAASTAVAWTPTSSTSWEECECVHQLLSDGSLLPLPPCADPQVAGSVLRAYVEQLRSQPATTTMVAEAFLPAVRLGPAGDDSALIGSSQLRSSSGSDLAMHSVPTSLRTSLKSSMGHDEDDVLGSVGRADGRRSMNVDNTSLLQSADAHMRDGNFTGEVLQLPFGCDGTSSDGNAVAVVGGGGSSEDLLLLDMHGSSNSGCGDHMRTSTLSSRFADSSATLHGSGSLGGGEGEPGSLLFVRPPLPVSARVNSEADIGASFTQLGGASMVADVLSSGCTSRTASGMLLPGWARSEAETLGSDLAGSGVLSSGFAGLAGQAASYNPLLTSRPTLPRPSSLHEASRHRLAEASRSGNFTPNYTPSMLAGSSMSSVTSVTVDDGGEQSRSFLDAFLAEVQRSTPSVSTASPAQAVQYGAVHVTPQADSVQLVASHEVQEQGNQSMASNNRTLDVALEVPSGAEPEAEISLDDLNSMESKHAVLGIGRTGGQPPILDYSALLSEAEVDASHSMHSGLHGTAGHSLQGSLHSMDHSMHDMQHSMQDSMQHSSSSSSADSMDVPAAADAPPPLLSSSVSSASSEPHSMRDNASDDDMDVPLPLMSSTSSSTRSSFVADGAADGAYNHYPFLGTMPIMGDASSSTSSSVSGGAASHLGHTNPPEVQNVMSELQLLQPLLPPPSELQLLQPLLSPSYDAAMSDVHGPGVANSLLQPPGNLASNGATAAESDLRIGAVYSLLPGDELDNMREQQQHQELSRELQQSGGGERAAASAHAMGGAGAVSVLLPNQALYSPLPGISLESSQELQPTSELELADVLPASEHGVGQEHAESAQSVQMVEVETPASPGFTAICGWLQNNLTGIIRNLEANIAPEYTGAAHDHPNADAVTAIEVLVMAATSSANCNEASAASAFLAPTTPSSSLLETHQDQLPTQRADEQAANGLESAPCLEPCEETAAMPSLAVSSPAAAMAAETLFICPPVASEMSALVGCGEAEAVPLLHPDSLPPPNEDCELAEEVDEEEWGACFASHVAEAPATVRQIAQLPALLTPATTLAAAGTTTAPAGTGAASAMATVRTPLAHLPVAENVEEEWGACFASHAAESQATACASLGPAALIATPSAVTTAAGDAAPDAVAPVLSSSAGPVALLSSGLTWSGGRWHVSKEWAYHPPTTAFRAAAVAGENDPSVVVTNATAPATVAATSDLHAVLIGDASCHGNLADLSDSDDGDAFLLPLPPPLATAFRAPRQVAEGALCAAMDPSEDHANGASPSQLQQHLQSSVIHTEVPSPQQDPRQQQMQMQQRMIETGHLLDRWRNGCGSWLAAAAQSTGLDAERAMEQECEPLVDLLLPEDAHAVPQDRPDPLAWEWPRTWDEASSVASLAQELTENDAVPSSVTAAGAAVPGPSAFDPAQEETSNASLADADSPFSAARVASAILQTSSLEDMCRIAVAEAGVACAAAVDAAAAATAAALSAAAACTTSAAYLAAAPEDVDTPTAGCEEAVPAGEPTMDVTTAKDCMPMESKATEKVEESEEAEVSAEVEGSSACLLDPQERVVELEEERDMLAERLLMAEEELLVARATSRQMADGRFADRQWLDQLMMTQTLALTPSGSGSGEVAFNSSRAAGVPALAAASAALVSPRCNTAAASAATPHAKAATSARPAVDGRPPPPVITVAEHTSTRTARPRCRHHQSHLQFSSVGLITYCVLMFGFILWYHGGIPDLDWREKMAAAKEAHLPCCTDMYILAPTRFGSPGSGGVRAGPAAFAPNSSAGQQLGANGRGAAGSTTSPLAGGRHVQLSCHGPGLVVDASLQLAYAPGSKIPPGVCRQSCPANPLSVVLTDPSDDPGLGTATVSMDAEFIPSSPVAAADDAAAVAAAAAAAADRAARLALLLRMGGLTGRLLLQALTSHAAARPSSAQGLRTRISAEHSAGATSIGSADFLEAAVVTPSAADIRASQQPTPSTVSAAGAAHVNTTDSWVQTRGTPLRLQEHSLATLTDTWTQTEDLFAPTGPSNSIAPPTPHGMSEHCTEQSLLGATSANGVSASSKQLAVADEQPPAWLWQVQARVLYGVCAGGFVPVRDVALHRMLLPSLLKPATQLQSFAAQLQSMQRPPSLGCGWDAGSGRPQDVADAPAGATLSVEQDLIADTAAATAGEETAEDEGPASRARFSTAAAAVHLPSDLLSFMHASAGLLDAPATKGPASPERFSSLQRSLGALQEVLSDTAAPASAEGGVDMEGATTAPSASMDWPQSNAVEVAADWVDAVEQDEVPVTEEVACTTAVVVPCGVSGPGVLLPLSVVGPGVLLPQTVSGPGMPVPEAIGGPGVPLLESVTGPGVLMSKEVLAPGVPLPVVEADPGVPLLTTAESAALGAPPPADGSSAADLKVATGAGDVPAQAPDQDVTATATAQQHSSASAAPFPPASEMSRSFASSQAAANGAAASSQFSMPTSRPLNATLQLLMSVHSAAFLVKGQRACVGDAVHGGCGGASAAAAIGQAFTRNKTVLRAHALTVADKASAWTEQLPSSSLPSSSRASKKRPGSKKRSSVKDSKAKHSSLLQQRHATSEAFGLTAAQVQHAAVHAMIGVAAKESAGAVARFRATQDLDVFGLRRQSLAEKAVNAMRVLRPKAQLEDKAHSSYTHVQPPSFEPSERKQLQAFLDSAQHRIKYAMEIHAVAMNATQLGLLEGAEASLAEATALMQMEATLLSDRAADLHCSAHCNQLAQFKAQQAQVQGEAHAAAAHSAADAISGRVNASAKAGSARRRQRRNVVRPGKASSTIAAAARWVSSEVQHMKSILQSKKAARRAASTMRHGGPPAAAAAAAQAAPLSCACVNDAAHMSSSSSRISSSPVMESSDLGRSLAFADVSYFGTRYGGLPDSLGGRRPAVAQVLRAHVTVLIAQMKCHAAAAAKGDSEHVIADCNAGSHCTHITQLAAATGSAGSAVWSGGKWHGHLRRPDTVACVGHLNLAIQLQTADWATVSHAADVRQQAVVELEAGQELLESAWRLHDGLRERLAVAWPSNQALQQLKAAAEHVQQLLPVPAAALSKHKQRR